jgi:hypothetical protein
LVVPLLLPLLHAAQPLVGPHLLLPLHKGQLPDESFVALVVEVVRAVAVDLAKGDVKNENSGRR